MKVFVAGASGAIGRPLVRQLVAAGHEVTGMTRREERAEEIRAAGAERGRLRRLRRGGAARRRSRRPSPRSSSTQLTALPRGVQPRKDRLRRRPTGCAPRATRNLLAAAQAAGARRFVAAEHRLPLRARGRLGQGRGGAALRRRPGALRRRRVEAMLDHEQQVLGGEGIEGLVLRYGWFYGPGTYYDRGGSIGRGGREAALPDRRRRAPASSPSSTSRTPPRRRSPRSTAARPASTTSSTTSRRRCASGCRSTPRRSGAKPPRQVPAWLARLVAGRPGGRIGVELRGASNAKAKRELGWSPRYPSWRQGFPERSAERASAASSRMPA